MDKQLFLRLRHLPVHDIALQAAHYPNVDIPTLLIQVAGWQMARTKLPTWASYDDLLYPPHLSMEQCSSETTARYKKQLVTRLISTSSKHKLSSFIDLTGGFGVDFSFMSTAFHKAFYVEQRPHLCSIAQHNFSVLGLTNTTVVNDEAVHFLENTEPVTLIYLDPARRSKDGGKTVFIRDCTPDVLKLRDLLLQKSDIIVLKLSPMLDWHQAVADLNANANIVTEVHIVSTRNECKELLIVMQGSNGDEFGTVSKDIGVYCSNDQECFSYRLADTEGLSQHIMQQAPQCGQYLFEPNASVMKAGNFPILTQRYDLAAIAQNSHLFVSDREQKEFPGRKFLIKDVTSFNKKEIKRSIANIKQANIAVRNFPMSVADLRKKLKIKEGGTDYLFATTTQSGEHILLICQKWDS